MTTPKREEESPGDLYQDQLSDVKKKFFDSAERLISECSERPDGNFTLSGRDAFADALKEEDDVRRHVQTTKENTLE